MYFCPVVLTMYFKDMRFILTFTGIPFLILPQGSHAWFQFIFPY